MTKTFDSPMKIRLKRSDKNSTPDVSEADDQIDDLFHHNTASKTTILNQNRPLPVKTEYGKFFSNQKS